MKSWKYEKDASTGEVYAVYHSVPIFKEHTGSDGTKYTQELLEDIADNNNDRIEETGDYCPIVGWHTPSDNDPSKDPPIIGFAENFRVEKFGKKQPKWCIYATFKIRKDKHDYFRDHPRRSVEIWPEDKPENRYIDPIAVLGAETPRQDLGLVYSKSAAGEESYMYSSVAGGGNTYVPGEVERNDKPGPKDPRRTPAPKKDRVKGSSKNPKGSASKANEKIEVSDKTEASLKKKMQEHNKKGKGSKATIGALKSVYRRGAGAFSTSHAPNMSRHGWAMARVNAFLTLLRTGKPSNSNYKQDNDLLPKGHPKKSKNNKDDAVEYSKDEDVKDSERNFLSGLASGAARAAGGVAKAGTKAAGKAPKATAAAPKAAPKATPSPSVKTPTTSSPEKKVDIAKEIRRRTAQAQQSGVGQRQREDTSPRMQAPSPAVVSGYSKDDSSKYAGPLAAVPLALGVAAGAAGASASYAKRKGPRPVRKPRRKSGFNFDKDDKSADVPRLDDVLDGAEEMALDQQDIQQIVEGLRPTIIDIVQQEIASIVAGEDMGPEDSLEEREEVDVIPDEELEDILEGKPDDEVLMGQDDKPDEDEDDDKDKPERNAKHEEDDAEKKAKCEYGKEMFAKMAEKHRLYEKDADHKGASQYMASMDDADRNAMTMYMKSEKAESHEKEAFAKCGEYGKDMKDSYSKSSEVAESDKYRKELSSQADKYSKLQQQYSKLQSELIEAKDQLTEVRRSERYHKIADRLANLEAEGYSFDKEKELEFCMQLSDEMREEHLAERIPQQYAKCPVGAPIPVEESEKLQPIEQKSIKYSRAANHATQKLRAQGHKGVSFEKVLKHMCDNDTDECPSVEDLK